MPELNESQKKQYNTYRAEGMTPERALSLATKNADNQYNPALEKGVDNIIFGKNSLTSSIVKGVKEATVSGFKTVYDDTKKYGAGFALAKSPLSLAAGVGRGAGSIIGGVLETADDLTGEVVSEFATPLVETALNSDAGQYLMQKGIELDEKGRGIPSDILDALNLVGVTGVARSGAASTIKQSLLKATDDAFKIGAKVTKTGDRLSDFFRTTPKPVTPAVTEINVNLGNIEKILASKIDDSAILKSLDEIKAEIAKGNVATFGDDVISKFDDILRRNSDDQFDFSKLVPEERKSIEDYIRNIETVLKGDDAANVVEDFISSGLNRVDNLSDQSVGIITSLSDDLIEKGLKTIENVKAVPAAISARAKEAIDRRIIRIATSDPEKAADSILDLYKRSVVPGVKKKNKTITNIEQINESVKRAVPDLAKKYQVDDLEDFARAISAEKKGIFSEIEKGLKDAAEKGKAVDMSDIVDELDILAASERATFSKPLRDAIARAKAELVDELPDGTLQPKSISPNGAQDLIADLNAQLQAYYRGSTPGTNADVIVETLVVNNLRKSVDDIVENLGEGSFKELKRRYADLKKMEDDVVHRAVFEAQKGGGLADLTDIISAGDIAAGGINPAFLAKGVGQFLTKEVLKSLNDKDELVRQMFLYGKNINAN